MANSNYRSEETDQLFQAILSLKTTEECYQFFEDLCTIPEMLAMAQRLRIARLLSEGETYANITKDTSISTTTVSRINTSLKYGSGGYALALGRLQKKDSI